MMCGEGSRENSTVVLQFMVKTAQLSISCLMPRPPSIATSNHEEPRAIARLGTHVRDFGCSAFIQGLRRREF